MEPRHIKIVLRWIWLLVLIPVLTGVSAFFYSANQATVYRGVSRLIIGPGISSPNPDLNALRAGALLTLTYAELTQTLEFRQSIIDDLGLEITAIELQEIVDIRPVLDTQVLNIVVDYTDQDLVIVIANRVAEGIVALSPEGNSTDFLLTRIQQQTDRLKEDILNTEDRLVELAIELESQTDPSRQAVITQQIADEERNLSEANTTLAGLYNTLQSRPVTNQVRIVDHAIEPIKKSSNTALVLLIALGAGGIISGMIIVLLIYLDTLIVDYETIRRYVDYPLWGHVRLDAENRLQNFRMLSTHFTHQHNENNVRSILLTGIEGSDHVASIATDLAITLSQIGKRVLLVDADFSNTVIEERFGIDTSINLIDVLTKDVIQSNVKPQADYPNLVVIPSGESSADSFFLIASPRLARILGQLEGIADYVIVSAPAMSGFEQSMAMAAWADGGVIIAQQGQTRVSDLSKAIEHLESVGGKVLGMVVSQ